MNVPTKFRRLNCSPTSETSPQRHRLDMFRYRARPNPFGAFNEYSCHARRTIRRNIRSPRNRPHWKIHSAPDIQIRRPNRSHTHRDIIRVSHGQRFHRRTTINDIRHIHDRDRRDRINSPFPRISTSSRFQPISVRRSIRSNPPSQSQIALAPTIAGKLYCRSCHEESATVLSSSKRRPSRAIRRNLDHSAVATAQSQPASKLQSQLRVFRAIDRPSGRINHRKPIRIVAAKL